MTKRVLAVVAGGIGNQIQMTAAVRTLRERLGWRVDIFSVGLAAESGTHAEVDRIFAGAVFNRATIPRGGALGSAFDGVVVLGFGSTGVGETWRGCRF